MNRYIPSDAKNAVLDGKTLKGLDSNGMHVIYDKWPDTAKSSFEFEHEKMRFDGVRDVVFAGMGGSGAIGDVFASILSKTDIHVSVVKGYVLPKTATKDTLVVTTSISGNTIETVTILREAMDRGCKIAAFSSGGTMQDVCTRNGLEYRRIERVHSPRASFVAFLYGMLNVLHPILPISEGNICESLAETKRLGRMINSDNMNENNPALQMAEWIDGIPMIYYPFGLQAAAIRFKNALQENAKTHAAVEDIIESCHNGIVAWERPGRFQPILLQGQDDYIRTKERWKVFREYFDENGIDFWQIHSVKGNILSKIITLVYLFDYCSIFLAARNGIDPSPVRSIDFIKNRI